MAIVVLVCVDVLVVGITALVTCPGQACGCRPGRSPLEAVHAGRSVTLGEAGVPLEASR